MASWEIFLFGPPRVEHDKETISVSRRKTVALLAYLSIELRPHSRDTLAALMWPEHSAAQAKANLRRDLSRLKNVLSDDVFEVDRNQAALNPEGNWQLDVRKFQKHVQLIRSHNHFPEQQCAECLKAAEEATQLYTADFMAGFTLPDSPEFDEWQFFTRESLRQSLAELLQRMLGWHTKLGEFEQAIEYGRRWLAMDTLHEPAHRQLMKLYAWAGQQAAAIRQYEECVRYLDEELGVPPQPETEALYESIFARQLSPPTVQKAEPKVNKPAVSVTPPPYNERYVTGELLAEGGHGEVYLGRDRLADIQVVIKRIKPDLITAESELITRFRQEGEILARLNHPNIVRMLDTFQHQGQYNIVMEYVPGGSLRELLKREKQLETDRAVAIGLELADALSRAHHLDIIHRDLKPENILIAEDGTPRLTDFGIAHLKRPNSRLTRTGTILGSPDYISPEIIQEGEIDGRSDIWSLGVVMYEMLAGKTPFGSRQIATVLFNIINEPAASLLDIRPDLPIHLVNLVHSMLKKDPAERPASMRQVAAVLEAIHEGRVPSSTPAYLTPSDVVRPSVVKPVVPTTINTPYYLPHQTTSFVGRRKELGQIRQLLVEEASCRLVTLVGPSGIGKTRLAVEAAQHLLDAFPDGVYFVSLASIGSADLIIPTIAETLGFQFSGPITPKAQLINYLRPKKMLLIADQLEQIVEGGQIISQLLHLAPHLAFLITLRERLQLTEEWSYEISGLALPEGGRAIDSVALETFSAAHLFMQRARRSRADFALHSQDIDNLIEICDLVHCSPLGLELAAPWVRTFSLEEIANRIKTTAEQPGTDAQNGSADTKSIKSVFTLSWESLTTIEQEALRRMSVFQGGCSLEAAAEITGASIETLNALMDKALIRQDGNGRYELHNLIRQFATETLQKDPEEYEVIYDIHCRYFLSYLEQQTPALKINQSPELLAGLTADFDNLRAAWNWAVKYLLLEDISPAAQGYWLFHRFRGLIYEGETTFRKTAERLINVADEEFDNIAIEQLAGFLKAGQGDLMAQRGWLVEGINEIEVGLELIRQNEDFDPTLEAFALTALASAQLFKGWFSAAQETAQESLELLPKRGDLWTRAVCLQLLGSAAYHQGQLDTAEDFFRACRDICDQLGEKDRLLKAKIGLSIISRLRGQYGRAQQWLDEGLALERPPIDRLNRAMLLREQGVLSLERGQFEAALESLEASKGICDAHGHSDSGLIDIFLGRYFQTQGDLNQANDLYRQGLAVAKAADYENGIAFALLHIGLLAIERGRLNQAEEYIQDALVIWQDIDNEVMVAQALRGLGDVSVQVGEQRAADARAYYRQALQLAVKHRLAPTGLRVILGLVPLLIRSGEVHQAIRLLILTEQHSAASYQISNTTKTYLNTFPADEVAAVRRETISLEWVETAEDLITKLSTVTWGQKPVHHNLPIHRFVFFGRHQELAEIQDQLIQSNGRLISIIGPGGIGKTSLAIATGAELASHFPQGVFLVPLAPLETADQILITLAETLGIQNLVNDDPKQQLLNYLKRKKMLLIFDNYEQLLPDVDFISSIIEQAPHIQMLVTTRQRLNLGAEMIYTLKGMTYPTQPDADQETLATYDAVQMLVGHARRIRPDIEIQAEEYHHIVNICNLVQGMPLALVLAVNWLDMLSFAEIAEEIADSLDFLESERGDLPNRQRSVRAVFNGSWSRLPAAAQETFARLTVFRGGFTREAARAVCRTSLRDLRTLVNSSFVTVSASGRYEVHELMRQLGAEQLEAMGTRKETKTDHSNYYLSFLARHEANLKGDHQIEALEEIVEDFENVRTAWNWALEQGNREAIDQAQECLHIFFDVQARYSEGRAFFSQAKEALAPRPGEKADKMYGRLLTRFAFLGTIIAIPRELLLADLEQGMAIAQEFNDRPEIALNNLARGSLMEDPVADIERFNQALQIYEALNDDFYRTRVYMAMANSYSTQMQPEEFKNYVYKAVDIARTTGNIINLSLGVANLAEVELVYGRPDQAQKNIDESIILANKMHAWLLISYCNCVSGFLKLLAGNFAEAEAGGRTALAQAEEIEHQYLRAFSLAVLSLWAGLTGDTDSGLKWALESNTIPENNMMGLVLVPWGLATNYARLGQWKKAAESLSAAFKQAEDQVLPAPLVWLMAMAALIAAEKGELETAVRFLSISKNHPFNSTGWMAQWPRLSNLETELKEQMSEAAYEAAWALGAEVQEETLPSELLAEVYDLLQSDA